MPSRLFDDLTPSGQLPDRGYAFMKIGLGLAGTPAPHPYTAAAGGAITLIGAYPASILLMPRFRTRRLPN